MITIHRPTTSLPHKAVLTGTMDPTRRVQVLIFSHDERWYLQREVIYTEGSETGIWACHVVLGGEEPLPRLREYLAVAVATTEPILQDVFESLNDLPLNAELSNPVSIRREG
jgi:hypothetical protein